VADGVMDPVMKLRRGLLVNAESGRDVVRLLEGIPVKRNVVY